MDIADKLKIRKDQPLYLIGAPADMKVLFPGVSIQTSISGKEPVTQLVLFAKDKKDLDAKFPGIAARLAETALLWIAYPKKSGSIKSDLIRDEGWETVFASDWEGVASAYIDEDWSGMRFRHKATTIKLKRLPPMSERNIEGVDFVKRTVSLPADAVGALKRHKGLEAFFYTLSFTQKREYVEAIVQSKKPETRERRIAAIVEKLMALQEKKREKKQ